LRKDKIDQLAYFRENELRLWERCYHCHVVKIFEVYDDGLGAKDYNGQESIYLLMEYADLGTIMSWNEAEKRY
jgi:serine/threonine protein kinase